MGPGNTTVDYRIPLPLIVAELRCTYFSISQLIWHLYFVIFPSAKKRAH
jgi:hypothetical protein